MILKEYTVLVAAFATEYRSLSTEEGCGQSEGFSRRGALNHRVPKEKLTLITPWTDLVLYQWGSRTAQDFFCPTCGILPFRRPADLTGIKFQAIKDRRAAEPLAV